MLLNMQELEVRVLEKINDYRTKNGNFMSDEDIVKCIITSVVDSFFVMEESMFKTRLEFMAEEKPISKEEMIEIIKDKLQRGIKENLNKRMQVHEIAKKEDDVMVEWRATLTALYADINSLNDYQKNNIKYIDITF